MGIKFEDIKLANETIITTDIKGKDYAEVNQRVKAFRMVYPEGFIIPRMVSNENGICIFEAQVGYYVEHSTVSDDCNGKKYQDTYQERVVLATGTAYEKEDSSFINKTSYIENCETSAVGRALGMAGFGIDTSIASADEVKNAIENQKKKVEEEQIKKIRELVPEENMDALLKYYKIEKLEELLYNDAEELIKRKENANGKDSKH